MTHTYDQEKCRENTEGIQMSASKSKEWLQSKTEQGEAGWKSQGHQWQRHGRIRGSSEKPQSLTAFPTQNRYPPLFLLSFQIWLQHRFLETVFQSMPNRTTLNAAFSKASPWTLSDLSAGIHRELVINGQNKMAANRRNIMHHTSLKEFMSGSPLSSDPDICSYLRCFEFHLGSNLRQPISLTW